MSYYRQWTSFPSGPVRDKRECYCPDDCGCHYPWRPTICGCRGHENEENRPHP